MTGYMDLRTLVLNTIKKQGQVKTADIVGKTGLSRAYVHRFLKTLTDQGFLILMGKANQAHYILPSKKGYGKTRPLKVHRIMTNKGLVEDQVLREIKEESAIFRGVTDNIASTIDYSFTEMLNNAIEHSKSEKIDVVIMRTATDIKFTVTDWGIGIFNNIMKKKRLGSTMEAIQDLLKGKETTAPEAHSGEGIFFTSKIADFLTIKSFEKKLVFDNVGQDIYVKDVKSVKGTKVDFVLGLRSKKKLADLFDKYTDESFQFSKTGVKVKLYHQDVDYVSRSQARRILASLEKFKTIELDFKDVKTIGQAFADEVFRIWQAQHKEVKFIVKNANENIMFMIKRAQS
jgi:anti-sigma regulatory factor (Ser/Thr protein kinase)